MNYLTIKQSEKMILYKTAFIANAFFALLFGGMVISHLATGQISWLTVLMAFSGGFCFSSVVGMIERLMREHD
jgi:hypothetical protein